MSPRVHNTGIAAVAMAVVLTLAVTLPASGQNEVSRQDRQFLATAHQGHLAEIAAGKLAQAKGTTETVRSIGATLVTDHTVLDSSLTRTARQLKVPLPAGPSADQKATHDRLAALPGTEFDQEWLTVMIDGNQAALALDERQLQDGFSARIKHLARTATPITHRHLDRLLHAQASQVAETG
ncbi:hypothetical protein Sme01_54390 [Sphaerisporangium melleum]|uniref:DUF4142 domain-containing protein n=1 Tax=Sphaerisporangium melleum TaxID=321316 RepID=A0A917VL58_9ACTN|nr:DUF4142 domain-containing protein [Sphaerisporangium melleum]GGK91991.1 hypothetical protein GCM10007964_38250 [Sphaerisporangium melleum]GII72963.1 hypothetical protein Sme01_54390 [Sphaerisporangium melleum]